MNDNRDDWLRKRVFELENVLEMMCKAIETNNSRAREIHLREARQHMPE